MKRSEVEHVLRAAAAVVHEKSFVVIGSQAILFAFPHAPEELCASQERDLYPALAPGVGDITVICPEIHDLAVSKCVAAREKDADFVRGLIRHGMIQPDMLYTRIAQLDEIRQPSRIAGWARRRAMEAAS